MCTAIYRVWIGPGGRFVAIYKVWLGTGGVADIYRVWRGPKGIVAAIYRVVIDPRGMYWVGLFTRVGMVPGAFWSLCTGFGLAP